MDDWNDDKNMVALQKSKLIEPHLQGILERWPRQCKGIKEELELLGEMEQSNELNPDIPANCFGRLLGNVFVWQEDLHAGALYGMGASLGRFVYLLDAANDLRADLKKQRYNPLVSQASTDFTPALSMMMGECTAIYEKMTPARDHDILQNVLYAGVWQRYRNPRKKEDLDNG